MTALWERQPDEPDAAWAAYLNFCARRLHTTADAAEVLDRGLDADAARWAEQYDWDTRAAAFDAELIRRRALAAAEEISLAGAQLVSLAGAAVLMIQAPPADDDAGDGVITADQITETAAALQAGLTLMNDSLALVRSATPGRASAADTVPLRAVSQEQPDPGASPDPAALGLHDEPASDFPVDEPASGPQHDPAAGDPEPAPQASTRRPRDAPPRPKIDQPRVVGPPRRHNDTAPATEPDTDESATDAEQPPTEATEPDTDESATDAEQPPTEATEPDTEPDPPAGGGSRRQRKKEPTITERCGKRGGATDHQERNERLCGLCVAYKNRDTDADPSTVIYPTY